MQRMSQGFALIIVLVFLEIFALLSLYALESRVLNHKIATQFWHKHLAQITADSLLVSLERDLIKNSIICDMHIISNTHLLSKSLDWWRKVSCTGNLTKFQYYYAIESLPTNGCSYIEQDQDGSTKKVNVDYKRLSLLLVNKKNIKEKVLLQSVLAVPNTRVRICTANAHRVMLGRQSWLELI